MTTEEFIKALFASNTQQCVHICSLGNERDGPHAPRFVSTRNMQEIERFRTKWDSDGRGLFFSVGTLEQGAKRNKENVREIAFLHADIDFKGIIDTHDDVVRKLQQLRMPPSIIVFSGNGIHAYWLLKEAITEDFERVESALRLLADTVGGDLQVCEVARLMRLPGSHNTKGGAWTPVEVQTTTERRYELDDLEEWLSETSPVILRTVRPAAEPETNPFLAAAAAIGFKPPLDVEQRLSAMAYMAGGDASIHGTQLAVTASLLNQGRPIEEVVSTVLDATKAAAGQYGARWNWRREENAIRKMCQTWVSKHPQQVAAPRTKQVAAGGSGNVVSLADAAKQVRTAKKKDEAAPSVVIAVADGVIAAVRKAGHDILLHEGEVWIYDAGIWHVMSPGERQWLLTLIQTAFTTLGEPPKNNNLAAAWKRLTEHPDLFMRAVEWQAGDRIVCQNGVLRFGDMRFEPHAPTHYAQRKIGVAYDPDAKCPMLIELLQSMFSDRGPERDSFVALYQQWLGAALSTRLLGREERKALLAVGPSRSGKTELSRISRRVLGSPIATPSVAEISERFGLQSLYGAAAWIRDDAINEGDVLDPQRFKTIVTGEPIDIERKYQPAVTTELNIPVLLTTNALPRARDKSDAIFNRSIILEMTNVIAEEEAVRLRRLHGVPRGKTIGDLIVEKEGPGILNWAIEGLRKLLLRGSYELPGAVQSATQRFKDDNNPVSEWARTALQKAPGGKVARHDLMCAYHGWQREQDGDDAKAFGARGFFPRLRAAAPWMTEYQDPNGKRFIVGVHLTAEGLQQWDDHHSGPQLRGGSTGISMTKLDVNRIHSVDANDTDLVSDAPRF